MDVLELLRFVERRRALIVLFGFDIYLADNGIYFTAHGTSFVFELPPDIALDVADAYHQPGQVLDFTHAVGVHGIGAAEQVLVVYARRQKQALLLEK